MCAWGRVVVFLLTGKTAKYAVKAPPAACSNSLPNSSTIRKIPPNGPDPSQAASRSLRNSASISLTLGSWPACDFSRNEFSKAATGARRRSLDGIQGRFDAAQERRYKRLLRIGDCDGKQAGNLFARPLDSRRGFRIGRVQQPLCGGRSRKLGRGRYAGAEQGLCRFTTRLLAAVRYFAAASRISMSLNITCITQPACICSAKWPSGRLGSSFSSALLMPLTVTVMLPP